ncbi:phosphoribosyl transferase [Acuticoccus sediminis]|uniref:Phosphoribosyl transferase n=1 Tax=Acuticoccus sediminis TaxID=2184697 RepID=A0A8B2P1H4_9HYPH|nr:phosphoribosyltransferase family protein [Acuticoccus sediminis]RAI03814.1 phosphoribosyl transferase [Acuticoccus sediminis]
MFFKDRRDAGRLLAKKLARYRGTNAIVLALPRGGVPVAYEVARALKLPFDLMLVRKLGVPGHEEYAMGAIANGDVQVLNKDVIEDLRIPAQLIAAVAKRERTELERRNEVYRGGEGAPAVEGRTVILVDDGIATGADMRAAVAALGTQHAARVVVAAPVASYQACSELREIVDEVVVVATPVPFGGVGLYYLDFQQTPDAEVVRLRSETEVPTSWWH